MFSYLNIAYEVSHNKIYQNKGQKWIISLNIDMIGINYLFKNLQIMLILNDKMEAWFFRNKI